MAAKGALIVDVRDAQEIAQSGKIAGAISVSRGMLEFRADPASAAVATLDGVDTSAGRVAAVLTLQRALTTPGGAFGASGPILRAYARV